jgi:hypothetical protein
VIAQLVEQQIEWVRIPHRFDDEAQWKGKALRMLNAEVHRFSKNGDGYKVVMVCLLNDLNANSKNEKQIQ